MRSAMRSLMSSMSGETERTGYSFAGEVARRKRDVVGWGDRIVGDCCASDLGECGGEISSMMTVVGTGRAVLGLMVFVLGPVRMLEGRICSKPWERATVSMDLKYCRKSVTVAMDI